jgi:hypothetical protein
MSQGFMDGKHTPRVTGPNFHYVFEDALHTRNEAVQDPLKERNWDARFQVSASTSNHHYHENYREYFDAPKPIDHFTQERFAPLGVGTSPSNFQSATQAHQQRNDKSINSRITGTTYRRPRTVGSNRRGTASKNKYSSRPPFSTAADLESGWNGRFGVTVSALNHQLHDCQREYFDIVKTLVGEKDRHARAQRGGVSTVNSRCVACSTI